MLNWLLRKRDPGRVTASRAKADAPPANAASALPPPVEQTRALWSARLEAARGDDAALLDLARAAPLLDLKLAAVEALAGEAALKAAEREFRSHDRKVHQRARQRLASMVARREARERAEVLIAAASALAQESPLAVNRLAALDRDWQALDAALLEPGQRDTFAALRDRLDDALRLQDQAQREAHAHARAQADAARTADAVASVPPPPPPPSVQEAPPQPTVVVDKPRRSDWLPRIDALLAQAEAALADGHTAALQKHLLAADAAIEDLGPGTALPAPLRARLQALYAERARLRGWQQWGGAVAREALVNEADALARLTAAAQAEPPAARLNLAEQGTAIRKLRARWKELDRVGAAPSQALWQRFDAALTLAHAPVAAHHAALQAAREENLAAREALLVALDESAARAETQRETIHAIEEFQRAWRKLGPIQHTVPGAAADALRQRVAELMARVETPLADARAAAQREREILVARAEALAAQDERDAVAQVRALQSEWQQHARALPLSRSVEAALWARFRQATDSVFARREAAAQARDTEAAAGLAAREAVLARLQAATQDASVSPGETARLLAQLDREWQQLFTPLPPAVAEGLEARWLDARAAAGQATQSRRLALWRAQCDALLERLTLCELRESGAGDADTLAQRWQAAAPAPAPWQSVLEQRWSGSTAAAVRAPGAIDPLLLDLEDALDIAPAPEHAQARRDLKLRAMKDALEGRSAGARHTARVPASAQLAELLSRTGLAPSAAARLRAVLGAVRASPQRFGPPD